MAVRHFLTLHDLSPAELNQVIDSAIALKKAHRENTQQPVLAQKGIGDDF
jgi:ornithine carbamoyltransferase